MQLTQADTERIHRWLEAHVSSGLRCFACGHAQWAVQNQAGMTVMYDIHTTRIHYMQGFPMIALICAQCGHMIWFSALAMGLTPDAPQALATTAPDAPAQ